MIIPRPNNLVVKPLFDPDISKGGIYIPSSAKERADQGIVKYVGRDVKMVQPGDWVLFSGYSGTYFEVANEGEMITMHERLVIAVIGPSYWATVPVPGLYFKTSDGEYHPAPYTMVTELQADAIAPFRHRVSFGHKPKPGEEQMNKVDYRPSLDDMAIDTQWTEDED